MVAAGLSLVQAVAVEEVPCSPEVPRPWNVAASEKVPVLAEELSSPVAQQVVAFDLAP